MIYIYTYIHACIHTYIHTYKYTHTHVGHIYIYIHIVLHMYTHIVLHLYTHTMQIMLSLPTFLWFHWSPICTCSLLLVSPTLGWRLPIGCLVILSNHRLTYIDYIQVHPWRWWWWGWCCWWSDHDERWMHLTLIVFKHQGAPNSLVEGIASILHRPGQGGYHHNPRPGMWHSSSLLPSG